MFFSRILFLKMNLRLQWMCMRRRERVLGLGKLQINAICWREAGGHKVRTWTGEILLALSYRASGRCCTAHCIFQLQFQPSDHCKPLCDLMFASLWQFLPVGASSFAPKLSGMMERAWLCKRERKSLDPKHVHIILKVLEPKYCIYSAREMITLSQHRWSN